jgi:TetR/AcrR family transcriptional regulator
MLHLLPMAQRAPASPPSLSPGRGLPPSGRTTRKAPNRRLRLRQVGAEMFATKGIENTSIAQIAHAAGISPATARDDYPTRADLLHDILHAHLDAMTEAAGEADDRHATAEPAARLQAVIFALFTALQADRHAHRLLRTALPAPARETLAHTGKLIIFRLYMIIEAAVPQLATARELQAPIARLLLATLGDAILWFRDDGALAREDYASLLARLLIDGAKSAIALHRS